MKVKHTKLPKECGYLGHFKDHLLEGHNTNPFENINTDLPKGPKKTPIKVPPAGGIRG